MPWLPPALIATLAGSLILASVYFYLFFHDRKRFLIIWAISWSVYAVRFIFQLLIIYGLMTESALIVNQLAALISGMLLLWGTYGFTRRKIPLWWAFFAAGGFFWIIAGASMDFSFYMLSLPTFIFLGIVFIWTGIMFLTNKELGSAGRKITGLTLIVWGIHKFDYPFLRPLLWFAPWGYLLGAVLSLGSALGILIQYFESVRTGLRSSEEKTKRLSREFKALLDAIPDNLTLQARDLKIIWANKGAGRGLGMGASELVDRYCYKLWHGREAPCIICPVQRSFQTGKIEQDTVETPDGRIWDLRAVPIMDEKGGVINVVEVGREITEHRRLEAQLRQAQKMEAVGQLAGGISHDFNNILTAIIGYGNLLLMKMDEKDPLRLHVEEILTASERAAGLTQSLLAFSRRQMINPVPVRINEIVRRVERLLKRLIGEDIELRSLLSDNDIIVFADPGQIEQVLMNLATNARDSMPDGGFLTIRSSLAEMGDEYINEHGFGRHDTFALISVADSGKGMDKITRQRIFEPFFTTKEVGKGTGLGLSMVYGIIKQHNGFIDVSSEPGKGAEFRIYLPVASVNQISEPEKTASAPAAFMQRGTETLLVAEDDEVLRRLTCTVLSSFGYKVIEAVDGEDAVKKFMANTDRIQLVVSDLIMPKKNGIEVYDEIRKIKPDIRAVFLSGYTSSIIREKGYLDMEVTLMLKPVTPLALLRKVREVLDNVPDSQDANDSHPGDGREGTRDS